MGSRHSREDAMTIDEALKQVERDGIAAHIDGMFVALYRNICDAYGGEEKIEPFHLANIEGSITRAKACALMPLENSNGHQAHPATCYDTTSGV